jgi:hypothetical protein
LSLLVVALSAQVAHANPFVLRDDQIHAVITTEIELAPRQFAKPWSLTPDVWFGVTPRLTLGLIHSNASVSRIGRGASFCFDHTIQGCQRTYRNAGLDARYAIRDDGSLAVAAHARFLIRDVDPAWKPAVTLGALVRWSHGRMAVTSDPYLRVGLANTDLGNRTALFLPLVFSVNIIERVAVNLHTGYDTDLAVWHDGFHIPLALSTRAHITETMELGLLGGFTSAFGPQDTLTRATLWFWLGWRSPAAVH